MNKFLLGAFYVLLILVFSFVVAAVYAYLKAKLPEKSKNEKDDGKPKIYYVTRQPKKRKKRRKASKKTEIALTSIAVDAERIGD